jgi:hypothetical protein
MEIVIDAPRIQIIIPHGFLNLVTRADNYADKLLMQSVLEGLVKYVMESKDVIIITEEEIKEIIEKVLQPANAKMFLFNDASLNIRLDTRGLFSLRTIHDADISWILNNLVSYLPAGYNIPVQIDDKQEKLKLCEEIVSALIDKIQKKIELFDGSELLDWLIKINEKNIQVRENNEIQIPAKIACFSDFDTEVNTLFNKEDDRVSTGQAVRTLIEFVAAGIPAGTRWVNFDDIEEILALVDQVIAWGSLSDSIYYNLANPSMGLLPSGRIGTDKTFQHTVLSPYAHARTTIDIYNHVEAWEKNYSNLPDSNVAGKPKLTVDLDFAFAMEFGISFEKFKQICGYLIGHGLIEGKGCIKVSEAWLYETIQENYPGISPNDISIALSLLTLVERKNIGRPPDGYKNFEIYPWRHKRALSYMRRPLVKIRKEDNTLYYYGYRHMVDFIGNLEYLLYSGKFPNPVSDGLCLWLGEISSGKGNPFRERVMNWFKTETNFEVIPIELDIAPNGHLKADKNYGDIDLLVVNHDSKIIYSIECKNITGAKTVYEMWSEIHSYLGDENKNSKAKITRHVNRDRWLQKNKASLINYIPAVSEYEIKSFVLTADEIPLIYIKNYPLPLPVKSFSFLRKDGISMLNTL